MSDINTTIKNSSRDREAEVTLHRIPQNNVVETTKQNVPTDEMSNSIQKEEIEIPMDATEKHEKDNIEENNNNLDDKMEENGNQVEDDKEKLGEEQDLRDITPAFREEIIQ